MFSGSDSFCQHKNPAPVCVEIAGAEPVTGLVFLAIGHRLSDLLNDNRPFIPIRRTDGATVIVAKQHIVSIVEHPAGARKLDPPAINAVRKKPANNNSYDLLRVAQDAPMAEITASCRRLTQQLQRRYKLRANSKNPQAKSALNAAKTILNAYKMILHDRGLDKSRKVKSEAPARATKKLRRAA